jgi:AraC-like DNA-binding protein
LEEYVRFYVQRQVRLEGPPILHPVPARASSLIEFIFGDRYNVFYSGRSVCEATPDTVVVGLQTYRRVQLQIHGVFQSFTIFFQPTGLHRLFSIPMHELTDHDFEASLVLGSSISRLRQRLGECGSFHKCARITNEYLSRRRLDLRSNDGISASANSILLCNNPARITDFAKETGLSMRQFERKFIEQVGVRPKLCARVARFEAALDRKARSSTKSWTDVAHEFGYYDQMHMVHEFEQFSGETPTNTLTQVEALFQEQIRAVRSALLCESGNNERRLIL